MSAQPGLIRGNSPAFPRPQTVDQHGFTETGSSGMSIREFYAAQAMAGMLAGKGPLYQFSDVNVASLTEDALRIADSLLAKMDPPTQT